MSNQAWWVCIHSWSVLVSDTSKFLHERLLLENLEPPADVENRFVRLCNNFDDLIGFHSFAAFDLVPSPSFCQSRLHFDVDDPTLPRNHLSLSGIIVVDMVDASRPPDMLGPIPRCAQERLGWMPEEMKW